MEDEFSEHLQKRVRNLQKRKTRLESYEKIRETEPERLNADQLAALANKDAVDGPLKELQDAIKLYSAAKDAQAAEYQQKLQVEIKAAEERGRQETRKTLQLFSQFLRTAAVKHQTGDTPADELAAVDELLQQLYLGNETSLQAVDKLAAKSSETVHGKWTYGQLHDLTVNGKKEANTEPKAEAQEEAPKISFLQEDELTEVAAEGTAGESPAPKTDGATPNGAAADKKRRRNNRQNKPKGPKEPKEPKDVKESKEPSVTKDGAEWQKAPSRQNDKKHSPKPKNKPQWKPKNPTA